MRQRWLRQRERGSGLLLRLMLWIALHGGRPIAQLLLYPIAAYFAIFSVRTRRASCDFLSRASGKKAGFFQVFRHYHTFATAILHRVYFLAGKYESFDV